MITSQLASKKTNRQDAPYKDFSPDPISNTPPSPPQNEPNQDYWQKEPFKSIALLHAFICDLTHEKREAIGDHLSQLLFLSALAWPRSPAKANLIDNCDDWRGAASSIAARDTADYKTYDDLMSHVAETLFNPDVIAHYRSHMRDNPATPWDPYWSQRVKLLIPKKEAAIEYWLKRFTPRTSSPYAKPFIEFFIRGLHFPRLEPLLEEMRKKGLEIKDETLGKPTKKIHSPFPRWETTNSEIKKELGCNMNTVKKLKALAIELQFIYCERIGRPRRTFPHGRKYFPANKSRFVVFLSQDMAAAYHRDQPKAPGSNLGGLISKALFS